jgi:ATP-dependent DNA helicase RecG
MDGTQQSGLLNLRIADLARDGQLVQLAREWAQQLLDADPALSAPNHLLLKEYLEVHFNKVKGWGRIS